MLLKHLQVVDGPVRLLKLLRIVGHKLYTRLCSRPTITSLATLYNTTLPPPFPQGQYIPPAIHRRSSPHAARPVAAESGIEDDLVVLELLVELAAALEVCVWRAPASRVGRVDVLWDGPAREEPDLDVRGGPLHGEDAAFGRVEGVAVGGGAFVLPWC